MTQVSRFVSIRGSDLSSSNPNKTYTLPVPSGYTILTNSIRIVANGANLMSSVHFTFSSPTITFSVNRYDDDYITFSYVIQSINDSIAGEVLKYSTVLGLVKHLEFLKSIPSNERTTSPNITTGYEEIGTGDESNTRFWFKNLGVIENTYTLYYGSSYTELEETTDYTVDLDTSEITLTSTGIIKVSTDIIYSIYKYNSAFILNSQFRKALLSAESKVLRRTEQRFANWSDEDPAYLKVYNERHLLNNPSSGSYNNISGKVIDLTYSPIVEYTGTVNGDFTLGNTSLTLTDGTGLPSTGSLNIDGNKIVYTDRTDNVLTVPSTTPSIDDGSYVHGEVIEISRDPEGNEENYSVLKRNEDYEIDFLQGKIELLNSAYWGELSSNDVIFPTAYKMRTSYFNAWHERDQYPTVPEDIEEVTYMIAAKKLAQRTIRKSHIGQSDNFTAEAQNSGDDEIKEVLDYYKVLNVGSSPYNNSRIS